MAGELIGALRVALGMDTAGFEAGSKKARAESKSTATYIERSFSKMRGAIVADLKSAAGALAAGLLTTELVAAGRRGLEYASSLGEVAQQLGVTTKDLQEYRYAASQVGIAQEDMDKSLAKLTKTIGQAASESKPQVETFREIGVAVETASGRIKTAGEIIPQIADALAQIPSPAARARIETELFGKSGQKLDTLLSGGAKGVNDLRKAAEDLGIVLSEEQIQNADRTADKLSELKQVLEARIAGVVADNAAAIYDLADSLSILTGNALEAYRKFKQLTGQIPLVGAAARAAGFVLNPLGGAAGLVGGAGKGKA